MSTFNLPPGVTTRMIDDAFGDNENAQCPSAIAAGHGKTRMIKNCDTYTAQVHSLLRERFCNCEPFTTADIVGASPWLEQKRECPRNWKRITSHVSAALCYLSKIGAVVMVENGHRNIYITDAATLAAYVPRLRKIKTGVTRHRAKKGEAE